MKKFGPAKDPGFAGLAFARLAFAVMQANLIAMRPWILILLVFAALAYAAMPFSGMAAALPAEAMASMPAPALQHAQHSGHGETMASRPGGAAALTATASQPDCPQHTKADISGHCAACLSLPAFLRLDKHTPFAAFVPSPALSAELTSRIAAPLVPPPRA